MKLFWFNKFFLPKSLFLFLPSFVATTEIDVSCSNQEFASQNFFSASLTQVTNKLERLPIAKLMRKAITCNSETCNCATLNVRTKHQTLTGNVRLGWNDWPGTNALAYSCEKVSEEEKRFYEIGTKKSTKILWSSFEAGADSYNKPFRSVIYKSAAVS